MLGPRLSQCTVGGEVCAPLLMGELLAVSTHGGGGRSEVRPFFTVEPPSSRMLPFSFKDPGRSEPEGAFRALPHSTGHR